MLFPKIYRYFAFAVGFIVSTLFNVAMFPSSEVKTIHFTINNHPLELPIRQQNAQWLSQSTFIINLVEHAHHSTASSLVVPPFRISHLRCPKESFALFTTLIWEKSLQEKTACSTDLLHDWVYLVSFLGMDDTYLLAQKVFTALTHTPDLLTAWGCIENKNRVIENPFIPFLSTHPHFLRKHFRDLFFPITRHEERVEDPVSIPTDSTPDDSPWNIDIQTTKSLPFSSHPQTLITVVKRTDETLFAIARIPYAIQKAVVSLTGRYMGVRGNDGFLMLLEHQTDGDDSLYVTRQDADAPSFYSYGELSFREAHDQPCVLTSTWGDFESISSHQIKRCVDIRCFNVEDVLLENYTLYQARVDARLSNKALRTLKAAACGIARLWVRATSSSK